MVPISLLFHVQSYLIVAQWGPQNALLELSDQLRWYTIDAQLCGWNHEFYVRFDDIATAPCFVMLVLAIVSYLSAWASVVFYYSYSHTLEGPAFSSYVYKFAAALLGTGRSGFRMLASPFARSSRTSIRHELLDRTKTMMALMMTMMTLTRSR